VNNNIVGEGTSKSKKDAEMNAAKVALRLFGVLE
jgi:dsRNA-specific ribonuclease